MPSDRSCPTCAYHFAGALYCPNDGTRLTSGAAGREGEIVAGRYRLEQRIGQGGMGEVYQAEHVYIRKRVALKLLRPEALGEPAAAERLYREARTASSVGHPNIVRIEDFGPAEDGSVYLAMEWLDGETLAAALARGPLDNERALRLALQICRGLAAAHAAGVVHRDLKPANIFLARGPQGEEVAKLLDFGIAKLTFGDDAGLTREGTFVGTPHYMSPEQALGNALDYRSDVYSMGVLLYELCTGDVPFTGPSFMGVLHQHVGESPQPPRERAPDRRIPAALEAIILRCLEKQPDERFASADELREALAALRPRRGSSARGRRLPPAEIVDTFDGEPVDRHRRPSRGAGAGRVAAATAAALALMAVGGWVFLRGPRAGAVGAAVPPGLTADAGPSAPAARGEWQHSGTGEGFDFTASLKPSPAVVGEPIAVDIVLAPTDAHLVEHLARGELEAEAEFLHYLNHKRTHVGVGTFATDGRLLTFQNVTFRMAGKYHVGVTLMAHGRKVGTTSFDICIGADPHGDQLAFELVCPRLNATGAQHSAREPVHAH